MKKAELEEVVDLLSFFIGKMYAYAGIETPSEFNPEDELPKVIQAIERKVRLEFANELVMADGNSDKDLEDLTNRMAKIDKINQVAPTITNGITCDESESN